MKILITGASGQLGKALISEAPKSFEIIKADRNNLDLSDPDACYSFVLKINLIGLLIVELTLKSIKQKLKKKFLSRLMQMRLLHLLKPLKKLEEDFTN